MTGVKPSRWMQVILRDICERVDYGYTASAKHEPVGPKFLRITDIVPSVIGWFSVPYCEISGQDFTKYRLQRGDVVIARTGATTGYAKWIKDDHRAVFASYLVRIRIYQEHDNRYVGLIIESEEYKEFIKANIGGAAQPQANARVLTSFLLSLPPLPVQRKIVAILSAYDDLIENNTRRIEILEEMADTTYTEWFVKFRFPGHESTNMVDLKEPESVPEGWRINKVKDIVKRLKSGNTYTQSTVSDTGSVPVIDQSRKNFLGFHGDEPDHLATPENPIIIFGDHTCKMQLMVEPFSLGPNVVPFASSDGLPIHFLYFVVKNLVQTREYKRHWTELVIKEVTLPPKQLARQFADSVVPMFEQINTLLKKNLNLSRTRDLLLPKLISGELEVEDLDIDTEGLGYG